MNSDSDDAEEEMVVTILFHLQHHKVLVLRSFLTQIFILLKMWKMTKYPLSSQILVVDQCRTFLSVRFEYFQLIFTSGTVRTFLSIQISMTVMFKRSKIPQIPHGSQWYSSMKMGFYLNRICDRNKSTAFGKIWVQQSHIEK